VAVTFVTGRKQPRTAVRATKLTSFTIAIPTNLNSKIFTREFVVSEIIPYTLFFKCYVSFSGVSATDWRTKGTEGSCIGSDQFYTIHTNLGKTTNKHWGTQKRRNIVLTFEIADVVGAWRRGQTKNANRFTFLQVVLAFLFFANIFLSIFFPLRCESSETSFQDAFPLV
jgi:hypothetical protein